MAETGVASSVETGVGAREVGAGVGTAEADGDVGASVRSARRKCRGSSAMSRLVLYRSEARFERALWQIRSSSREIVSSIWRSGRGSAVAIWSITSVRVSPRKGFRPVRSS